MHQINGSTVVVRRRCDDKKRATYRVQDVSELHMQEVNGTAAKRSELHGYVWCDALLQGELAHECAPGSGAQAASAVSAGGTDGFNQGGVSPMVW
jgi:hypothetical protein